MIHPSPMTITQYLSAGWDDPPALPAQWAVSVDAYWLTPPRAYWLTVGEPLSLNHALKRVYTESFSRFVEMASEFATLFTEPV